MVALKEFYFSKYEDRVPEPPLKHSKVVEFIWQCLAICTITLGARYLYWRWEYSINFDVLWFSIPVFVGEICAFIGLLLFVHNLWSVHDTPQTKALLRRSEVIDGEDDERLISVDVFLPTYNEDPELTRHSIRDAKSVTYPGSIEINVHVLDDGNREQMRQVADEERVNYITRATNIGYKAGNLRNGMSQTHGDFIVILDSDTRAFPTLLSHTLGYFRDRDVAWVQTPQWFYDVHQGRPLPLDWAARFGTIGHYGASLAQCIMGPIVVGRDPFVSDAKLFYDVIQRRRNGLNVSFCCGAGSVHRREAIMEAALKSYAEAIEGQTEGLSEFVKQDADRADLQKTLRREFQFQLSAPRINSMSRKIFIRRFFCIQIPHETGSRYIIHMWKVRCFHLWISFLMTAHCFQGG